MPTPFDDAQDDFMVPEEVQRAMEDLYQRLTDAEYLRRAWMEDELGVKTDWVRLEAYSSYRMENCYLDWPDDQADPVLGVILGELFGNAGHLSLALPAYARAAELALQEGEFSLAVTAYIGVAEIQEMRGGWRAAVGAFIAAQELCQQTNDLSGRLRLLNRQAGILQWRGRLEEAMALLKEGEKTSLQMANPDVLFQNLFAQRRCLIDQREWEQAAELLEDLHELLPHYGTASCDEERAYFLRGRAAFCYLEKKWGEALDLYVDAEVVLRQAGLLRHIPANLRNQGRVLLEKGDRIEAGKLFEEAVDACGSVGDQYGLQDGLRALGALLGSTEPYEQAEEICRKLGYYEGLQACLGERAGLLRENSDILALLAKQERICQSPGYTRYLAHCLVEKIKIKQLSKLDVKWDQKTVERLIKDPSVLETALAEEGEQWICPWCHEEASEEVDAAVSTGRVCPCGGLVCGSSSYDLDDLDNFFRAAFFQRAYPDRRYDLELALALTQGVERLQGKLVRRPDLPYEVIYLWERLP